MAQETQSSSNICFLKVNQCLSESNKVSLRGEKGAKVKEITKEDLFPSGVTNFHERITIEDKGDFPRPSGLV